MAKRRRTSRRDGETLFMAVIFAIYYAYQKALEQPLLASLLLGLIVASFVMAILLVSRSRRIRKANLLARTSLYKDYSPIEFEHVTAEIFRQLGFEARVTPASGDEGLDVILSRNGRKIGVQCKQYKNPVGPGAIREFSGSLMAADLTKGYFVTTSDFTEAAKQAAKKSKVEIRLISGEQIGALRNQVDEHINTDLIPWAWWGRMTMWQKGLLIVLFYICVMLVVSSVSYVLLTMMIMNAH
jgi:HJR/Mrr/RecB family endonuclease